MSHLLFYSSFSFSCYFGPWFHSPHSPPPPPPPTPRVCLLHHIERIDHQQPTPISFFDTYWFVLVTLSTVGYGDIAPKHWTGKLLVAVFIITALIYLIPQLEELFEAFQMQRKLHNTVSYQKSGKHIIVCAKRMKPLVLRDFLTEFYSDPSHYVRACMCLGHMLALFASILTVMVDSKHQKTGASECLMARIKLPFTILFGRGGSLMSFLCVMLSLQ